MRSERDGEGEDTDKKDQQRDGEAGHVLEASKGVVQEGGGAIDPVRCGGSAHRLLLHRQAI